MTIQLNKYLTGNALVAFERVDLQKLREGVNVKYNDKVYNIVIAKAKKSNTTEVLAVRIHTDIGLKISQFWLTGADQKEKVAKINNKDNNALPKTVEIMGNGVIIDEKDVPYYTKELTAKESDTFSKKPELAPLKKPPEDPPKGWSPAQKAGIFLAGFIALSAIAYGAHRKGILPSRKDIGEFLSQKKASLSEMWQSWHKKPEVNT